MNTYIEESFEDLPWSEIRATWIWISLGALFVLYEDSEDFSFPKVLLQNLYPGSKSQWLTTNAQESFQESPNVSCLKDSSHSRDPT